jgi:hypothetical protein
MPKEHSTLLNSRQLVEISVRAIVVFVLLSNALIPTMVSARSSQIETSPTQSQDIDHGITLGAPDNSSHENVPILSDGLAHQAAMQTEAARPRISVSAEPAIYISGRPIQISWTLIGVFPIQRSTASIIINASSGATPVDPALTLAPDGSLTIPVTGDSGVTAWNVNDHASFPISFGFRLLLNGNAVAKNFLSVDSAQVNESLGRGSSLKSMDGRVQVEVPPEDATEPLLWEIRNPGLNSLTGFSLSWQPREILAVGKNSGKNYHSFTTPLTIKMHYDVAQIMGVDENELSIYYYDPVQNDWFPMQTQVDTVNKTLTAQSDHLTVFDYKANDWQSQSLPTVDAFKVSDFTGAGTYAINLWTPPGPGGLQPSLSLTYNSQVIDESTFYSQASWVGMGWDLDTGSIIRDMHGTDENTSDDTFSITVGGVSGMLLPISSSGTIKNYNTADQSFSRVQFDSSANAWTVWTKDGKKYVFSTTAKTNSQSGCSTTLDLTWRWSLTSVTDTHGNALNYTYYTETKPGSGCLNQIAVYPATITYPNSKYRIVFARGTTPRYDYQTDWTTAAARTLYGTQYLSEVDVQYNPSGTWKNIRRYVFTYNAAPTPQNPNPIIYPNFRWNYGPSEYAPTLTLDGVQEFGSDGKARPAVLFNYGDDLHLTQVDNGQGGKVQMTYKQVSYLDDEDVNHDLRQYSVIFGDGNECNNSSHTTWGRNPDPQYPGYVGCTYDGGYYLQAGGPRQGTNGMAYHWMPENIIKPGAQYNYSMTGYVHANSGSTGIMLGFIDADYPPFSGTGAYGVDNFEEGGGNGKAFSLQGSKITMPATFDSNSQMVLSIDCDGCLVSKFEFAVLPTYSRVTQRTVGRTAHQCQIHVQLQLSSFCSEQRG